MLQPDFVRLVSALGRWCGAPTGEMIHGRFSFPIGESDWAAIQIPASVFRVKLMREVNPRMDRLARL
jgi:hypothetical protein